MADRHRENQAHLAERQREHEAYAQHKAAEQGSIAAQNNLGVAYVRGFGVPQDKVEAYA